MKNYEKISCKYVVMMLCVIAMCIVFQTNAYAMYESESNDSAATADVMSIGTTVYGSIPETSDLDIYKFSLPSSGQFTYTFTSYMPYYTVIMFDEDGNVWWTDDRNRWNESLQFCTNRYVVNLEAGTYYMKVLGKYWEGSIYKGIGTYELSSVFTPSGANIAEPNNSFAQAKNVSLGKQVKGHIAINDRYDIYKVTVPDDTVRIDMTSYMVYYSIYIYDMDADTVWYTTWNEWDSNLKKRTDTYYPELGKGTYYVKVIGDTSESATYRSTGNYTFKFAKTANSIKLNKKEINLYKSGKEKIKLKATVTPAGTGEKVTYSVKDTTIATVSSSGVVKAKQPGYTTLTAYVGNISTTIDVFVAPKQTKILKLKSSKERRWGGIRRYITFKCKKVKGVEYVVFYSKKKNGKYKELEVCDSNKETVSFPKKGTYWIKIGTRVTSNGYYVWDTSKPNKIKVK